VNDTRKIIFVFTKLGQFIMSEEASLDSDATDKQILAKVNESIRTGFVLPVKKEYPKARMVVYDVTKASVNKYHYHKESLVITTVGSTDTAPVWNIEHLRNLIEIEAQENNKTFCEQFRDALLSQANSTLAVIINYYTSDEKEKHLKMNYQKKVINCKEDCKREFQSWIQNGAEIRPHLDEYDKKDDTVRFRKDTYANDLCIHIQSFLQEKVTNKILSLCDKYANILCQDLMKDLKSKIQNIQSALPLVSNNMSPLSLLSVMLGSVSGVVGGVATGAGLSFAVVVSTAVAATGIGAIVGIIVLSTVSLGAWSRESVKDQIVSSTISHLIENVLQKTLIHIENYFVSLGKKIDELLTIAFSGANAHILEKEAIYKQIKDRINVINLMNTV